LKWKLRNILSRPVSRQLASWCGKTYIDLIHHSTRWRYIAETSHTLEELVEKRPIIFCVWHGRQLMMPKLWPPTVQLSVVGSTSRDGRLALATAERFRIKVIPRSRGSGSSNAARVILAVLRSGHAVGLTPDGSRGPRMRVAKGVVELAKLSGCPLVPATYSCSNAIILSSWDRFMLPLPFGRGVFSVGAPIDVDRAASPAQIEEARFALERQMNMMTAAADAAVGRAPIMPTEISQTVDLALKLE
jgi:lysophospholipid acyltransferase (LPLAT)-like uncharacterized protein